MVLFFELGTNVLQACYLFNNAIKKMSKIDKKIIDAIDLLSKSMTKNNLSEIEISDGSSSYKLKKFVKKVMTLEVMKSSNNQFPKKNEPSL